jgi:serine/threonine protein kinase
MVYDQMNYGRYQIIEELGQGSMGVVYKANDPQIDRIVALKVLRQDRMTSDDFVRRFMKEAQAIGRLSHPNIVTIYDVGQDNNSIYIAMEFLEGSPLNEIIDSGLMPCEQVVTLGIQVADALHYASRKGIIHRDIKPTNIIISLDGQAKLTDFGIARIENPLDQQQTQIGEILGTPAYMSPEQAKGQNVDKSTDLFSLGIILYELCTGRRPFAGDSMMAIFREIMKTEPADPTMINPAIPSALAAVIMKSLRKKPAERFQSGKEMAESLKKSLIYEPLKTIINKPESAAKSKPVGLYLALLVFMLIVFSGTFYFLFSKKGMTLSAPTGMKIDNAQIQTTIATPVSLNIESMPPGAQIFINNSFYGTTPLVQKLSLGKYEVRLSLHNYFDWEAQLQLDQKGEKYISVELLAMDSKKL